MSRAKEAVVNWAWERVVGAILGSTVVTALANALLAKVQTLPLEWRVVAIAVVALLSYVGLLALAKAKGWGAGTPPSPPRPAPTGHPPSAQPKERLAQLELDILAGVYAFLGVTRQKCEAETDKEMLQLIEDSADGIMNSLINASFTTPVHRIMFQKPKFIPGRTDANGMDVRRYLPVEELRPSALWLIDHYSANVLKAWDEYRNASILIKPPKG